MTIPKNNLLIAVFVFFGLFFSLLIIFPLFREIRNNSQKLILQKEKMVNDNDQKKNLEQFRVSSVLFSGNFKKIDNLFVDSEVPVEFIRFLEDAARSDYLQIVIISSSQGVFKKNKWPFLSFQIVVNGFFPDFLKFLEKIENGSYLIQIRNLNIAAKDFGAVGSGGVEANFTITVFTK